MLTRKQAELLRFIHERLKEAGVPPSFDEMKDALDLRSKSGIHRLITALEERGFIRRLPNRARAIEVIKLPESVAHGIVAGRVETAVDGVVERGVDEDFAALEGEDFVDDEVSLERRLGYWDWIFFGHFRSVDSTCWIRTATDLSCRTGPLRVERSLRDLY